ncbi:hypothetical protein HUR95_00495 [Caldalkalibacillus thermarum TA2.A1]|uniref:Group II intron maturase-specific domain-containing protein n=1 Tax=Caldalkalibacillus thermarum (strain TA2.A1) TaxID=986075 RepID=A0A8X8LBE3_CALTT|nr:group II intron maturase-specific domain-containing protein [Caldalkalibacillus thermarum]QZT33955.1 hypothetical protein HUR95_00495 [Caldalkalibacillus thermarum TA2.A1]
MTNPNWSISMAERTEKLNQYTMGWIGHFALIETPSPLKRLEKWIRSRFLCAHRHSQFVL